LCRELEGKRLVLFLDYDGTLTSIVKRPRDAKLSESMRAVVKELASACPLAIVSGRDRRDVEELVRLDGVIYAGSHGYDITGPGGLRMEHEGGKSCLPHLEEAERKLHDEIGEVAGVQIERKRYCVAVHYRNVAREDVARVKNGVAKVSSHHHQLRLGQGKKVLELQPGSDWDKGKAVSWLLATLGLVSPDVLPIYLGDDITDEDAFRALAGRGIGFVVGKLDRRTAANYHLKDVGEVEELLSLLVKICRDNPS
jgi:trehalose-phosphatase